LLGIIGLAFGGPISYGTCQAGCASVVVACYAAAGAVFGTVTLGAGAPPALIACSAAYAKCQAVCAGLLLFPTP
ncbi:cysteine-rich protein, partial [Rozella allomycis CSF55]